LLVSEARRHCVVLVLHPVCHVAQKERERERERERCIKNLRENGELKEEFLAFTNATVLNKFVYCSIFQKASPNWRAGCKELFGAFS